ncbi:MAG: hypothetical protein WD691_03530 [Acidimicrobiales bacterium]
MSPLLVTLAVVTALAAAMRSTWSPCGLSMLSTITPIGERGRRNRYHVTALWFVVGALLGGATLGAAAAALAAGVALVELSPDVLAGAAAVCGAVTIASDLSIGGFRLPTHTRQVNETWLDQYRSWVYGGGFGWQIGVGLATYVTTSAVYLLIVLAALTASPLAAFYVVTGFGLVRGLAVYLGRSLTTPERMMALHRRLDELLPAAQRLIVLTQAAVVTVAAAAAWGPAPAVAIAAAAGVTVVLRQPRPATRVARPA